MSALNLRYPDFNQIPNISGDMIILVYDPLSDLLYKTPLSSIISKNNSPDLWQDINNYGEGDLVTYPTGPDSILQAYIAVNPSLNSPPSLTNPDWRPASTKDLDLVNYDGTGPAIVLAANNLTSAIFRQQDIDGDRVWDFVDHDNLLEFTIFINLTGAGGWSQDFTAIGVVSDGGNWDAGVWTPNQAGKYKLKFEFTGFEYYLTISNLAA